MNRAQLVEVAKGRADQAYGVQGAPAQRLVKYLTEHPDGRRLAALADESAPGGEEVVAKSEPAVSKLGRELMDSVDRMKGAVEQIAKAKGITVSQAWSEVEVDNAAWESLQLARQRL